MFWKKKNKDSSSVSSGSTNPFDASSTASTPNTASESEKQPSTHYGDRDAYSTRQDYSTSSGRGGGRYGTGRDDEAARNELFGPRASKAGRNAPYEHDNDGGRYGGSRYAQQEEEDEEVANIKRQIRDVKQDSLASTRNALAKLREAEAAASNTMSMLGEQSSQIANVDRNLDLSKAYSDRAAAQANELKQLNRSIFIPVVKNPFTRSKREQRELERLRQDQAEHMAEREEIRQFEYESNARLEQAQRRSERVSANAGFRRGRTESDRRKYQFEADEEDDAVEDEIDENLDGISDFTARLKNMALTMNEELDSQNKRIDKMTKKVDPLNEKLAMTTHKLNNTR